MKKRFLSLILVLAMMVGVFTPLMALASNGNTPLPAGTFDDGAISLTKPEKTKLYVHKLQASSFLNNVPANHNGGKLDLTTPAGVPDKTQTDNIIGTNVKPLNGVKFKYYLVEDEKTFKDMVEHSGDYQTEAQVKTKLGNGVTGIEVESKTVGTDEGVLAGADGQVLDLPDGNYWFIETGYDKEKAGNGAPDNISSYKAVPFGISLPLTNISEVTKGGKTYAPGTVWLSEVHTYPKNVTGKESIPKKTVGNEVNLNQTNNVGDVQTWYLQATIPANIKDYEEFEMNDIFFKGLTYKGNVSVYMGYDGAETKVDLTKGDDYTLTEPAVGTKFSTPAPADLTKDITPTNASDKFQVKLTAAGIAKLAENFETVKKNADKSKETDKDVKVYAKVDTVINEEAKISVKIPNTYDLKTKIKGQNEKKRRPDKTPDVKTGGKRFKKIDKTYNKALDDAVFTIKHQKDGTKPANTKAWNAVADLKWTEALIEANKDAIEAGKFALKDANKEVYKPTSSTDKPVKDTTIYIRSGAEGAFEIKGLEYSNYTITEWDKTQKKFVTGKTVNNYYALKEVKAPKDYALSEKEFEFTIDDASYFKDPTQVELVASDPKEIENKKLTIPQTGGIGTIIFTVVGLAIMGSAIIAIKKRQAAEAR